MLTYPELVRDDRASYRPFRTSVADIRRLTPHFTLVTLTGPELEWFGTDRLDQRIKLVFPIEDFGFGDMGVDDPESQRAGDWYARWRALPESERNPFRTYTVRDIRPERQELDVLFVDHGVTGPAARWISGAAIGDHLVVVGPDARSLRSAEGIDWHPGSARELLLAGDETAVPAIWGILESLPAGSRARVFVEVPSADDVLPIESAAEITITWLPRNGAAFGVVLENAVRGWVARHPERVLAALTEVPAELEDVDVDLEDLWETPADEPRPFYAWLAGEAAVIKTLRRFLVTETGVDRSAVAFMGYWRLGKAEEQ